MRPVLGRYSTVCLIWLSIVTSGVAPARGASADDPEAVLRTLVHANAQRDLDTMAKYMAQEEDAIGYSIGGRKYRGWSEFARDMQMEFDSVVGLTIPIRELQVWTRGPVAWFVMELDYIREVKEDGQVARQVLPLRETGVLERRDGRWLLVTWHESLRAEAPTTAAAAPAAPARSAGEDAPGSPDVSGEWEIHEEDRSYTATLDRHGNGPYTWQNGRIATTEIKNRKWQGTWHQPGNDREGGFELLLSEDGTEAKGVWWYSRVGDRTNIPPRQWGGTYLWKRVLPKPSSAPPQP